MKGRTNRGDDGFSELSMDGGDYRNRRNYYYYSTDHHRCSVSRSHVFGLFGKSREKKRERKKNKKNQFDITNFYSLKTVSKPKKRVTRL